MPGFLVSRFRSVLGMSGFFRARLLMAMELDSRIGISMEFEEMMADFVAAKELRKKESMDQLEEYKLQIPYYSAFSIINKYGTRQPVYDPECIDESNERMGKTLNYLLRKVMFPTLNEESSCDMFKGIIVYLEYYFDKSVLKQITRGSMLETDTSWKRTIVPGYTGEFCNFCKLRSRHWKEDLLSSFAGIEDPRHLAELRFNRAEKNICSKECAIEYVRTQFKKTLLVFYSSGHGDDGMPFNKCYFLTTCLNYASKHPCVEKGSVNEKDMSFKVKHGTFAYLNDPFFPKILY